MAVEQEANKEQQPSHSIEWKGSVAHVYEPALMLGDSGIGEVVVYDRSDFQTPIERAQVTVQKVDIDGETATALTATLKLDQARNDYERSRNLSSINDGLFSKFTGSSLDRRSKFVPYNNEDRDLAIEGTVFPNVFKASHGRGTKVLVWVDQKTRTITISNNLTLSSTQEGNETTVQVRPPADGTIEVEYLFEGFFKAFMRTVDFTAGLPGYNPENNHLKRTYAVGKERNFTIRSRRVVAPGVGSSALGGASTPDTTEQPKPEKLPEELAGLEVVDNSITLDDVGGLETVKKTLRDIAISFQHPEIMEKWGASRPQGVLMYGEPGTGKTMLAQALANEIGAEMWALQSSDIYERWLGASERHIKELFERARNHKGRLILFFDEFDSIVGTTEGPTPGGADTARNAVAGIFKQEMNLLAKANPDVLVVAATNNLDRIDPALVRTGRFDHKIYVPMPDQGARQQIITNLVARSILTQERGDFKVFGDNLDIATLATETDGMSGADITEIFRRLSLSRAMQEVRSGEPQPPLTQEELLEGVKNFRTNG